MSVLGNASREEVGLMHIGPLEQSLRLGQGEAGQTRREVSTGQGTRCRKIKSAVVRDKL